MTDSEVQSNEEVVGEVEVPEGLHPLQNRWGLWYLKGDRSKNWEDCLKQVAVFDSVENFWALYNHIQPSSALTVGSDYYLFKEGIKPMWEHPQNVKGGRWFVMIDKSNRAEKLDKYWLELMMACVGEQFQPDGEHICGAVVNVRNKGDKVALWTRDSTMDTVNLRIGQIIKDKLGLNDKEPVKYEVHADSVQRVGSVVKPKHIIPAATTKETTPAPK